MVIDLHLRVQYLSKKLIWFNEMENHFIFQFSDDSAPETSDLTMSIGTTSINSKNNLFSNILSPFSPIAKSLYSFLYLREALDTMLSSCSLISVHSFPFTHFRSLTSVHFLCSLVANQRLVLLNYVIVF